MFVKRPKILIALLAAGQLVTSLPALAASNATDDSAVNICRQTKDEYLKAKLEAAGKGKTADMKKLAEEYEEKCVRNPLETTRKMRGELFLLIISKGLRR